MKSDIGIRVGMFVVMLALVSAAGGVACAAEKTKMKPEFAEKRPMTPELAAKREMVRKQQEQRITPEKRKAAAEALKAERLRVYKAKQAVKESAPSPIENK